MMLRKTPLAAGLMMAAALLSAGCSLAPAYQAPDVPYSEQWIGVALQEQQDGIDVSTLGWRDYFLDRRLQKLIEVALMYNHDLKTAALNIELAQQQYQIKDNNQRPTINSSAGLVRKGGKKDHASNTYNIGIGINSFELDFFGRVRNLTEAALNDYLKTKEARDAAQLSLIASVATTYFQWRISEAQAALSKKVLASRRKSYHLIKLQLQEGLANALSLSTALTALEVAKVSYQKQLRSSLQAQNTLAVIIGKPIADIDLPQAASLDKQFPSSRIYAGIPSKVLLNRPDIREAEYALKSANANIGVARASLFPVISLTTNLGFASGALRSLFSADNKSWSVGPSITAPIFDYSSLQANARIAEIKQQLVLESYAKTVQTAFKEIDDALIARNTFSKEYQAQKRVAKASADTLNLVKLQFREGLSDGLDLLNTERNDFESQQNILSAQLSVLNNQTKLYTALGGGLFPHAGKKAILSSDK